MGKYKHFVCLTILFFLLAGVCGPAQAHFSPAATTGKPSQLAVYAFVSRPLLPIGSEQELSIAVLDQELSPLEGALVGVIVYLPGGKEEYYRPNPTNADGISKFSFTVTQLSPREIIPIEVMISFEGLEGRTSTWFRAWW